MKRIALHTLGCKLNFAETASFGKQFAGQGYDIVGLDEPADVVVINTCSVTERADRECRQLVRRALRRSPDAFVAVVGCYAQLQPQEIAAIKGVDLVLGTKEKFDLAAYLTAPTKRSSAAVHVSCIGDVHEARIASSAGFEERTRVFLKVQDGCDYSCSFCTIPLARGESRSVEAGLILEEARAAVEAGYREVVLTGVNVGTYGAQNGGDLMTLLKDLVRVEGLDRIRVSSIEPNLLTDDLLAFWIDQPRLCNHFHIPLQSGSDTVLRNMRRRYIAAAYREKVERIKSLAPDAGIGADVIVGFPGETHSLFDDTYRLLLDLPVTYLHVFSYSERPHTPAASFSKSVDPKSKAERSERLRALSLRKRRQYYESFVGRTVNVLFEEEQGEGEFSGLTGEYVRATVHSSEPLTNRIMSVRITEAQLETCRGDLA